MVSTKKLHDVGDTADRASTKPGLIQGATRFNEARDVKLARPVIAAPHSQPLAWSWHC